MKLFDSLTVTALAVMAAAAVQAQTRATVSHTAPGTVMADGTVFAGYTADGVKLYTTRCDAGQSWDGSACTGTRQIKSWRYGTGDVPKKTGFSSRTDGTGNTAGLVNLSDAEWSYQSALHCDNLTDSGHSDWYLPAIDELSVLQANKTVVGGFSTSSRQSWKPGVPMHDEYWSSSENNGLNGAWFQNFTDGGQSVDFPISVYYVRCVRR